MIRKLLLSVLLLAVVCMAACKCTAEKGAVTQLQGTHDVISKKFLKYVKADAAAQVAAKTMSDAEAAAFVDDWQKTVDSDQRNIDALKKSVGD